METKGLVELGKPVTDGAVSYRGGVPANHDSAPGAGQERA